MLKYCILIGCSLPPKSDIMQDDVNCPISLSWKRWWHHLTNNTWLRGHGCFENHLSSQNQTIFVNLQEIIEEIEQNVILTSLASHKTTAAKSVSSLLFIFYNWPDRTDKHCSFDIRLYAKFIQLSSDIQYL